MESRGLHWFHVDCPLDSIGFSRWVTSEVDGLSNG